MKLDLLAEAVMGNWDASYDTETKDIFPKLPNGQTIKVTHVKSTITLTHLKTRDTVQFWITKLGNHYDSRMPNKTVTKDHVIRELNRMLGPGGSAIYTSAIAQGDFVLKPKDPNTAPARRTSHGPSWVLDKAKEKNSKGQSITTYTIDPETLPADFKQIMDRPLVVADHPTVKQMLHPETELFMLTK